MNIGQIFKSLSQRTKQVLGRSPKLNVRLTGFEASLNEKQGVLLVYKPEGTQQAEPASQDRYYVLTVRSTGRNPEYPHEAKPRTFLFTISANKSFGMTNGVHYLPVGSRFTGFEIAEKYDDGKKKPDALFMGKLMPAHHTATIKAHYRDVTGRKQNIELGFAVRRTEQENPEWRAASGAPTFGF